jgi:hypothetical protein
MLSFLLHFIRQMIGKGLDRALRSRPQFFARAQNKELREPSHLQAPRRTLARGSDGLRVRQIRGAHKADQIDRA